jgi:hypothetical protein
VNSSALRDGTTFGMGASWLARAFVPRSSI